MWPVNCSLKITIHGGVFLEYSLSDTILLNSALENRLSILKNLFSLYQFLIAVRQDGSQLTNDAGEVTSHLNGLFYRTIRMIEAGLKPVYVFDGKPPTMKSHELEKRREARAKAQEELEEAKEAGTATEVDKQERRLVKVTKEHVAECKKLLELMGVPFVEADTEAEAQVNSKVIHRNKTPSLLESK